MVIPEGLQKQCLEKEEKTIDRSQLSKRTMDFNQNGTQIALKTRPESGVVSCVPFYFRSLLHSKRCEVHYSKLTTYPIYYQWHNLSCNFHIAFSVMPKHTKTGYEFSQGNATNSLNAHHKVDGLGFALPEAIQTTIKITPWNFL